AEGRGGRAAVLLVLTLGAGCTSPRADGLPRASLITGSTGSSWYSIGSAVADRTNGLLGGHPLTAVPGAGGISNPARIARAPGDFGISFTSFLRAAYRGDAPYRQAYPELRHVATLIENKLHLVIGEHLGIEDVAELVRRRIPARIGTGPPGSGEEFLLRELMVHHGATYEDLRSWGGRVDLLGTGERADAWRDGHIDVIAFSINDPAPVVAELLTARPGRLAGVDAAAREALSTKWRAIPHSIPADTYPGQQAAVPTLGLAAAIFTTAEMPEAMVYAVTRAIAENKPYLETVHAAFKSWQPARMPQSDDVPLHPGAARYYRERSMVGS
ncbi:MAG TPA: TAXI family TRAP transporter solute-binding subunit, partial [Vicinamibacteria bacterium]|nr:TAXI family TRAP transporter solute-binding subunit [Vicinamibacteria bacterium]